MVIAKIFGAVDLIACGLILVAFQSSWVIPIVLILLYKGIISFI